MAFWNKNKGKKPEKGKRKVDDNENRGVPDFNQPPKVREFRDMDSLFPMGGFSDFFASMVKDMDSLIDEFERQQGERRKPFTMGFSLKFDENGQPVIEHFGNMKPKEQQIEVSGNREPLTDVTTRGEEVVVTAELPGVEKEQVALDTKENTLIISAKDSENKFYKEVKLPAGTQPKTANAKMNNGILEISFKRDKKAGSKTGIKIE